MSRSSRCVRSLVGCLMFVMFGVPIALTSRDADAEALRVHVVGSDASALLKLSNNVVPVRSEEGYIESDPGAFAGRFTAIASRLCASEGVPGNLLFVDATPGQWKVIGP